MTFDRHVAPILFDRCAVCHRPEGAAPFALLTYDDARRRARQIVEVTASGYMPPWLPAPGRGEFVGERRLAEAERSTLRRWLEQGTPPGDAPEAVVAPRFDSGWTLGPPDLELAMTEAFTIPASGPDVYRNFVLPVPIDRTRYVRAVEFRPGSPTTVHHARVLLDPTPVSRQRDAESPAYGFAGMDSGAAAAPDGHLLGWTPGKVPAAAPADLAWRLDPGDDLVLQLHMVPSGKPESIQASIGLYFTDRRPTRRAYALILGSREIDIPAGAAAHVVRDRYELPIDVEALAVYPHAHYIAREMRVWAELPTGERRWLIHIPEWDFNWQDEYRFARGVSIPRGSALVMEFVYDNSADNVRNPSSPPRRVRYGANSTDEMAEVMIQVLPAGEAERARLEDDFERFRVQKAIAYRQERLAADPLDAASHAALASSYLYLGQAALAVPHLEAALRIGPESAGLHQNLGYALRRAGRVDEAARHYRRALELAPDSAEAAFDLAQIFRERGQAEQALALYRRVLRLRPESARTCVAIAELILDDSRPAAEEIAEAVRMAELAVRLSRGRDRATLELLATAYDAAGLPDRAREVRATLPPTAN
ncbi:MAG TPA: tetratricopeptide repeat protein [Candidatus Polarisedimenticolaceae bacterium]|nr:tetratricopeptide repeat protein [Candidatus Polarisedimenticolaceae bacterium]